MTLFHSNILHDVERECLNHLNACLINLLNIYSVLLISFMAVVTMANLHWTFHDLFALVNTVVFYFLSFVFYYHHIHYSLYHLQISKLGPCFGGKYKTNRRYFKKPFVIIMGNYLHFQKSNPNLLPKFKWHAINQSEMQLERQ